MVINSAQMQNAGNEFMLFQSVSMKSEAAVSKDSFSAIFNNVTGRNDLFQMKKAEIGTAVVSDKGKANNITAKADTTSPVKETIKKDTVSLDSEATKKVELVDANEAAEEIENTDEVTDDFIEKAASLFVQITVTITVVLNVSMEELSQGMQELGLTQTDLLQADNRYNLFVDLKASGDAANLLKDNSLVDMLNTMENQIADLFETAGLDTESFSNTLKLCMDTVVEKTNDILQNFVAAPLKSLDEKTEATAKGDETEAVVIDGIVNEQTPKVEVSSQSQNDSTDKNNTESSKKEKEQPIKAEELSNRFVNHLVDSFESKFQQIKVTEVQQMPDIREIVNQIMEQVKIHVNNSNTSIEIQLTPEALGKVQVSVEDNNGVVTAKFQAESRVAKEAIESNLVQFKEHLAEQGIKVDSVEVSVGNFDLTGHGFGKGQGQEAESHGKKRFSMDDAGVVSGSKEDLKDAAYIDNGTSTVSFTA